MPQQKRRVPGLLVSAKDAGVADPLGLVCPAVRASIWSDLRGRQSVSARETPRSQGSSPANGPATFNGHRTDRSWFALHGDGPLYKVIIDPRERDDQRGRSAQVMRRDRDHVPCGVDDPWRLLVTACTGQGMARVRSRQARPGPWFLPRSVRRDIPGP